MFSVTNMSLGRHSQPGRPMLSLNTRTQTRQKHQSHQFHPNSSFSLKPIASTMSRRAPGKLPIFPKNAAGVSPHYQTFPGRSENSDDAVLEAALRKISHALNSLDFNQFVTISPVHSPVYSPVWKPDPDQFQRMALNAFAFVSVDATDEEVQAAMLAKTTLNDQLVYVDGMFKYAEESGRPVGNVRLTLSWMAKRNRETYLELNARPMSHPLDRNPLPATPKRVRWADKDYSSNSPTAHSADKYPEETYARFLADASQYKHGPPQTPPSNRSAKHNQVVRSPNGYAWQGNSQYPVHETPGRTQVYVRKADNSVSPRSCLKPTDENAPFIPPHPSYYSEYDETLTGRNAAKLSSRKSK